MEIIPKHRCALLIEYDGECRWKEGEIYQFDIQNVIYEGCKLLFISKKGIAVFTFDFARVRGDLK